MSDLPLLELEVGSVATGGGCVARAGDGRVVFVRHCLPGERVIAGVTEETKSYLRADVLRSSVPPRSESLLHVPSQAPADAEAVTGSTSHLRLSGD